MVHIGAEAHVSCCGFIAGVLNDIVKVANERLGKQLRIRPRVNSG